MGGASDYLGGDCVIEVCCPKCQQLAEAVKGDAVYPHRPDLYSRKFYLCRPCETWAPRANNGAPLALMADARVRLLRIRAHAAFDPMWKSGSMTRSAAYAWLRTATGLTAEQCHMSWMGEWELRMVLAACAQKENPA